MGIGLASGLVAGLGGGPAMAELRGPKLGAASNFGQSWQPEAVAAGADIGILRFRDEVIWNHVEQADGTLAFSSPRESYPRVLAGRGAAMTLLGYTGHPAHDGGRAPRTTDGQAAFASYHARILRAFPLIDAIEVGNEYNSHDFASTQGWPGDMAARARVYVDLLARTAAAARAERPGITVLGGAAHSVPVAWARAVMAAGAGAHMDAFVLHPYTTAPEQFRRQVAVLRRVPGLADMPLAVTEFGTKDATAAPGYLVRYYCQMALAGVTRADWYPFSPRGDGLVPLVGADGAITATGAAWALILARLEGRPVRDVAPDAFTYACRFGEDTLVIWGAPRAVTLGPDHVALDVLGRPVAAPVVLDRADPLVIIGPDPRLGGGVRLGPQRVLADSFDQFPQEGGPDVFVRRAGAALPLVPRPGQEADGVPWTPYLGFDDDGSLRVGAGWARPSAWGPDDPLEIVYRYTAPADLLVEVEIGAAPSEASEDGVTLALERDGRELSRRLLTRPDRLGARAVPLRAGQVLDIVLGPNRNATGDHTDLRITLRRAE
ncbi:hypothetical protein [Marinibacterium sp. SX1]|uniref:hypothetical protein n=1 Tax=Marinibacterium sp. SX1 TaxID=3388424 RepID=UPI003D178948